MVFGVRGFVVCYCVYKSKIGNEERVGGEGIRGGVRLEVVGYKY